MMDYEYGIAHHSDTQEEAHREGMTKEQAYKWIDGWLEDGGRPGVFFVIRCPVGEWEEAVQPNGESSKTPDDWYSQVRLG